MLLALDTEGPNVQPADAGPHFNHHPDRPSKRPTNSAAEEPQLSDVLCGDITDNMRVRSRGGTVQTAHK
jgi:hypothetical protein